ncbi:nuclear transport factor 2 family protein [Rhodococcus gannanensis]|uniref:Nuclear transport factor 2 family protein n=1 Tax=Rhodococcus gannanensis TaxID=1960308 RepID=A0ABW4P188_9NOCA
MSPTESVDSALDQTELDTIRGIITDLENERFDLILARNFTAFAQLCHPEMQYTHSSGVREGLDRYIDECKASTYVYHQIEHPIEAITVHGDTALVHGRMKADLSVQGTRKTIDTLSLAVWVNTDEGWKLLGYQGTSAPQ